MYDKIHIYIQQIILFLNNRKRINIHYTLMYNIFVQIWIFFMNKIFNNKISLFI